MRRRLRLGCFLAAAAFNLETAAACSVEPPPPPPPRTPAESEAEFEARSDSWYRDIAERERQEGLPIRVAYEDRLWSTAQRVALARVERVGTVWLRGSEGQMYDSRLVTLRPIRWFKGPGTSQPVRVHLLSDDSCDSRVGDVMIAEPGEVFLLFYGPGSISPRNILDTLGSDWAVTQRSQRAFDIQNAPGSSPPQ